MTDKYGVCMEWWSTKLLKPQFKEIIWIIHNQSPVDYIWFNQNYNIIFPYSSSRWQWTMVLSTTTAHHIHIRRKACAIYLSKPPFVWVSEWVRLYFHCKIIIIIYIVGFCCYCSIYFQCVFLLLLLCPFMCSSSVKYIYEHIIFFATKITCWFFLRTTKHAHHQML